MTINCSFRSPHSIAHDTMEFVDDSEDSEVNESDGGNYLSSCFVIYDATSSANDLKRIIMQRADGRIQRL